MEEKPKIIKKLELLYLVSSVIFFVDTIFAFIVLIIGIFPSLSDPSADQALATMCLSIILFFLIICFIMGIFSLKIRDLMKKGNKLVILEGLILSAVSLIIFILPLIILILMSLGYSSPPFFSWVTLLIILIFLTLFFNILIVAISLKSNVRVYSKLPLENK